MEDKMQSVREAITEIIYDADWEIRGVLSGSTRDIREHYLVDEEKVVDEIIAIVREADLWPHPFWRK